MLLKISQFDAVIYSNGLAYFGLYICLECKGNALLRLSMPEDERGRKRHLKL